MSTFADPYHRKTVNITRLLELAFSTNVSIISLSAKRHEWEKQRAAPKGIRSLDIY